MVNWRTKGRNALVKAALVISSAGLENAVAQEFPVKPIRIVVANTPGTLPDQIIRTMQPVLANAFGKPVVVENKPGAQERIAAEYVAKQPIPDGHTMAIVALGNMAGLVAFVKNPSFIPLRDLPPIKTLATGRIYLASPAQAPWKTFSEMITYAKANPGKLNYGSWASSTQIRMEMIILHYGLKVVHVPYAGSGPAQLAMYSNDIQFIITNDDVVSRKDRALPLAVSSKRRVPQFPDVPTFAELGLPTIAGADYYMGVPTATPAFAVERINSALSRALQHPDTLALVARLGLEVVDDSREAAVQNLKDQTAAIVNTAKLIGMQLQ